jgi:ABC-type siderophore export system fused ATPase/permease subunit
MAIMYAQIRLEYGTSEERKQLLAQLIQLAEENDIWMFSEVENRKDQSGNREMFYQKYMNTLNNVLIK